MNMAAFCYIIFSPSLNKFYVGATQEDPEIRLQKHNASAYGNSKFTAKTSDWLIFLTIQTRSYRQALAIEKHIKSMKSTTYIRNLKQYNEMVIKLLEKYKTE